jgi:ATP-binding cassette, subfamily C, bacterial CydD
MGPVEPRLLRCSRPAQGFLLCTAGFGLAATALTLVQTGLVAHLLAAAAPGDGVTALAASLLLLLGVLAARALAAYGSEVAALRAAAQARSRLRQRLTTHALRLGPDWLAGQRAGEITTLASKGLDSLDAYFARFLPQLLLAVVVPVAVLVRVAFADWISAVVIAVTLPLVPLFGALVGGYTGARSRRQWRLLAALGGHFLDVVEGLATLKLFGRGKAQAAVIGRVTEEHRAVTMSILRVAFLSALVLELAAALATALVAVEVGLRLLYGQMSYETALLVLLLTPEAYLPLRAVAIQYHASREGAAAASRVFEILAVPVRDAARPAAAGRRPAGPDLRVQEITLTGVGVRYPRRELAALGGISLTLSPGDRLVLTGPSGAGKSTLLALLLRFVQPSTGTIRVGGTDLAGIPAAAWPSQIAWMPQHPYLFPGSVAGNIALGRPAAGPDAIRRAAALAGAAEFIENLPRGYDTPLGERAMRLSAGQRQKIALARAFLCDAPLLLLDEPAAHLDRVSAAHLWAVLADLPPGRTVVLVTHDTGQAGSLGRVLRLHGGRLLAPARPAPVASGP